MELIGRVARDVRGTFETVSAPLEFDSPEPSKLLKDEPFMTRLVVDAVMADEYMVDEE
jgi:DNA-binding transcriptional regulator LsrR (DeoR family)